MESVSSVLPALTGQTAGKLKQLKKAAGGGALLGGAFCALDFLTVPGAILTVKKLKVLIGNQD